MKACVIGFGHRMPNWVQAGIDDYARRMPREVQLEVIGLKPQPRAAGKPVAQVLDVEADQLLRRLPREAKLMALDERGAPWSTARLAEELERCLQSGRDAAFAIGSADGLALSLKRRADHLIAVSTMTLPHTLVRVLLAEQLYRAASIIKGHPYHRE